MTHVVSKQIPRRFHSVPRPFQWKPERGISSTFKAELEMTMVNFKSFRKLSFFSKVSLLLLFLRLHLVSQEGMLICSRLLIKKMPLKDFYFSRLSHPGINYFGT